MGWLLLVLAIVLELSGTVSMKLSDSFSRLGPSILMFVFYAASFTCLNYTLGYMKVSTVYAIWSGVGIVLISLAGGLIFQEKLTLTSILWIGIIVIGVVGLNISGKEG
ncbi:MULTISPECIES: DMT family transporter [Paenibacillus]|uniref:Multidrug SMR transporter n=2 Tax=Paenibacillus TaxID=44249 RepID=A0A919Y831_9BACL|nr:MULTISPECIES: multidrug efflux SMR transporter [Paenibacillus]GIO35530.1 multidrug SMR transporter [Paenibacillus antibioticophila]GIO44223.1 multidrug SMR transporter [Paenibacillus apis]